MIIKTIAKKINPITRHEVPKATVSGDFEIIAIDADYFYVTDGHCYEYGVPIVTKYSRNVWEILTNNA